jgi:hypothetical protein
MTKRIVQGCLFLIVLVGASASANAQIAWSCDAYPPTTQTSTQCVGFDNSALDAAAYSDSLGFCNNGYEVYTDDNADAHNFLAAGAHPAAHADSVMVFDGSTPEGTSAYAWAWTIVNGTQEYNFAQVEVLCDSGSGYSFESNGGSYTAAQAYADRQ